MVVFHVCVGGQKVCRVAEFLVPSIVISMVGGVTASPLLPVRNAAHTRSNRDKMILATTQNNAAHKERAASQYIH